MSDGDDGILIEWSALSRARSELGADFVRILGYFQEDGVKSVSRIEAAMRGGCAASLIVPADRLKSDAREFGADQLADCAETIEMIARDSVESHDTPDQALEHVVRLRPLFDRTLAALDRETNPLVHRPSA